MDLSDLAALIENQPQNFKENTFDLVSKVAYLIGVPKTIFENEHEPPQIEIYKQLEKDKTARIVRNLCVIRNAIERNYKNINNAMRFENKSLFYMSDFIPQDSMKQLSADGVSFIKGSNNKLNQHIIEINRLISDRINNCKGLFPLWINWDYIKMLFIMENGLKDEGVKAAAELFYSNMSYYPYKVYMNWIPADEGNVFYNDKKFAELLYMWNNDYFGEMSKVSDAGDYVKSNIYDYIEESEKIVVAVDCENSDPYKFAATIKNLDDEYLKKINSIILFDDIHTASAWRILEQFTDIPVEHELIERVKENKSLVDIKLTARACQEHYANGVDSFIICSSDSDYWGLVTTLSTARFLFMIEHEKSGPDIKAALSDSGIFFCYLDDFYSANAEEIKQVALFSAMRDYIDENVHLNVNDMLNEALKTTRIEMGTSEKNQFINRYIKTLQMSIAENGDLVVEFKRK